MANKHTRKEHISYRRKREAAVKEQNRKQLTKKQKVQLWTAIGAAVLALLLFLGLALPAMKGAVPTWFGTPMFAAKDAILGKITVVLSIVLIVCIIVMNILAVANG